MANYDWITEGLEEEPTTSLADAFVKSLSPGLDSTLDQINKQNTPVTPRQNIPPPPVEYSDTGDYDWITQGLDSPPEERGVLDTVISSLTPGLKKTVGQINRQNRPVPVKPSLPDQLPPYDFLAKEMAERRESLGPDTTIEPSDPFADLEAEDKVIEEIIPAYQVGSLGGEISEKQYQLSMHEWRKANPNKALISDIISLVVPGAKGFISEGRLTKNQAKKLAHEVDQMNIRLRRKGRLMTTDDLNSFGKWVDYIQTMTASSAEHMGKAILSGGTMTPLLMVREMNANLEGIEGLDINERMAIAHTGGLIAGALEMMGLGLLVKGVPKEVLGKIGVKKLSTFLEKTLAGRLAGKATGRAGLGWLTEAMTEGSQEGVAIIAEILAGRDFKPGEISKRLFEATVAGGTVGGTIGGAAGVGKAMRRSGDVKEDDDTFVDEKGEKRQRIRVDYEGTPKFDKTIDRRKKLALPEEELTPPDFEPEPLPERWGDTKFLEQDFRDDTDLGKDEAPKDLSQKEEEKLIDDLTTEKKPRFRIQPKPIPEKETVVEEEVKEEAPPAELTPEVASTPQTEEVVSPPVEPEPEVVEEKPKLTGKSFEGEEGREDHLTRKETGTVDPSSLSHIEGKRGEKRGEHRNKKGKKWEDFKADIKKNGVKETILITKDFNEDPVVVEGNHRLDAALEVGLETIPVEINYYGKAEDQGLASQTTEPATQPSVILPEAEDKPTTDAEIEAEEMALEDQQALDEKELEVESEREAREAVEDYTGVKEEDEVQLEEQDESDRQEAERNRQLEEKQAEEDAKPDAVNWNDEGAKVPTESLFRNKDDKEYYSEEFPDGITYDEYRDVLRDIKNDQLIDQESNYDADDSPYSEQLDTRADNNFKKAFERNQKKKPKVKKEQPDKPLVIEEGSKEYEDKLREFDELAEGGARFKDEETFELTDEDREVELQEEEELVASKGKPVKGIGQEAVQKEAETTFGKKTVRRLLKNNALKIVKSAKDLPNNIKVKLMTAYHGTAFDIDKFDTDRIGTGTGRQFEGWGLYFASQKKVAEWYRELFLGASHERAKPSLFSKAQKEGGTYQVDLAPNEDEFLEWEKPISEQSDKVKKVFNDFRKSGENSIVEYGIDGAEDLSDPELMTGKEFYQYLSDRFEKQEYDANRFPAKRGQGKLGHNGERGHGTSLFLLSKGIKGNKFLDDDSLYGDKDNTFNYVIFDDSDITIEAKFAKSPAAVKGAYDPETGISYLVADNIAEGEAPGVFLHEIGEHASLEQMVGEKNYNQIAQQLDDLVEAGDEVAKVAVARVPKDTKEEHLQSEKIAYLVQEVQDRSAKGETVSSKVRTLYNRVMNLIRKFMQSLPAYRKMAGKAALKKLEAGELLTPENMASLARQAVDYHSEGKTKQTPTKEKPQFAEGTEPEVAPEPTPEVPLGESINPEVTKAITEAHGKKPKKGDSIWKKTLDTLTSVKDQMTRAHRLLDPKKFGATTDYLRLMQETGNYAKHRAYTDVYSVVGRMSNKEQLILSMNLILPDMKRDIETGVLDPKEGLPFGYQSLKEIEKDIEVWKGHADKVSADASTDTDINKSIEKRTAFMKELRKELIAEGLLRKELLEDDRYFHHQVLEYLNAEDTGFKTSLESPGRRITKQGWQKARTGTIQDYNTKYLDAEFEVLSQARQQLEAKKLLNKIKEANDRGAEARKLQTEFNEFLKSENKEGLSLEKTLKKSDDFDGYVVWEPNPKGAWYQTFSIADKVAQQILEDGGATVTDTQKVFAKGAKEKWVIPKELAETLNKPTKNENDAWPVSWSRKGVRAWKVWTLLNPFRIFRYNLNNMSGDLDIALAYAPGITLGMKKSATDLYKDKKNPEGKTAEELNDGRKRGIIDSGFVITEVDDFSKMYEGLFDPKPSNTLEKITKGGKSIPDMFRKATTYRENIIRLAAWRHFKKKIAANPDKKYYAASKQTEIDQIRNRQKENETRDAEGLTETDHQIAAKLARELIGDYGNISHGGQAIRTHIMPFYSWMEINAPRYIRLMRNAKAEGTDIKAQLAKVAAKQVAWKGTALAMRMMVFSTFVSAWNHMMFPEEEEKLSEFEREQLHIILGTWDDEIITLRFQGAFSDFVAWLSLHDAPSDIADLVKGNKSVTDQLTEMAKAPALKIAAGVSPLFKVPMEQLSGETYWPDFLSPRPIRDRYEHLANSFSLGTIYKQLAGKPNKGAGEWLKLFLNSTDPGESAYYKNWQKVREWRDKLGKDDIGGHKPTSRQNALYYYKQAMKYQDISAAKKYYDKYVELSGGRTKSGKVPKKTLKALQGSIDRANPRSRIPSGTWNAFSKSLTKDEKKTWMEGKKWYTQIYKKKKKKKRRK